MVKYIGFYEYRRSYQVLTMVPLSINRTNVQHEQMWKTAVVDRIRYVQLLSLAAYRGKPCWRVLMYLVHVQHARPAYDTPTVLPGTRTRYQPVELTADASKLYQVVNTSCDRLSGWNSTLRACSIPGIPLNNTMVFVNQTYDMAVDQLISVRTDERHWKQKNTT